MLNLLYYLYIDLAKNSVDKFRGILRLGPPLTKGRRPVPEKILDVKVPLGDQFFIENLSDITLCHYSNISIVYFR